MPFCHDVLKRENGLLNWNKDNRQNGSFMIFALYLHRKKRNGSTRLVLKET